MIPIAGVLGFSIMKMKWTKEVYESIETQLHKEKLKTFCFSLKEYQSLNWIDSREFVLAEHWYDVVEKIQLDDGSFLLTVFSDHKEREWWDHFFSQKNNTPLSKSKHILEQNFKCSIFQDLIVDLQVLPRVHDQFIDITHGISAYFYSKFYPPPRAI